MNETRGDGPVIIELDDTTAPQVDPASAPPVPETNLPAAEATALGVAARWSARRPSRLGRWFMGTLAAFLGFAVSIAAWNFVAGMLVSYPSLGLIAALLAGILILLGLALAIREAAGIARLGRLDKIQRAATKAQISGDLAAARLVSAQVQDLYRGRTDMEWALRNLSEAQPDHVDAADVLIDAERHLMEPLDRAALVEIQAAARQVATVTALVPLALADVVAALTLNLRMIRRIAEIYGGRSGTIGNWRLIRQVLAHLVATGAVAVGDDLLEPLLGGGVLAKVSRRFGEGLVNGALTARVGLAATDVCRPLPRIQSKRPRVRQVITQALGGLFKSQPEPPGGNTG